MAVRIPKIDAMPAPLPGALLLDGNSVCRQPLFPTCQLARRNRERDVQFAISIVRRGDAERGAFFEQQKHLMTAGCHGAAPPSKVADHAKAEDLLVEARRADYIIDI